MGSSPTTGDFQALDEHIESLYQEDNVRIMNLKYPIPPEYPWEDFLKRHFARDAFDLTIEDYEYEIVGNGGKILKIKDGRKPTTFYSLFRFLEFFRSRLEQLEENLKLMRELQGKVKTTREEKGGLRSILKSFDWNYNTIANKHNVMRDALNSTMRLETIVNGLEGIIRQNTRISDRWESMIEPFYRAVTEYINKYFQEGAYGVFNLKKRYTVEQLRDLLAPHFAECMKMAIPLNEAVRQSGAFLRTKRGLFNIADYD